MKKIACIIAFICATASLAMAQKADLIVDTKASTINWDAKKVVGGHVGTIDVKEGLVKVDGRNLVGGSFVIDMPSLNCTDAPRLNGHLKNEDFFDVEKFPTATFVISKVTKSGNAVDVSGKLTIRGITKDISFPATVNVTDEGLKANATIKVNRLDFDIKYRSASIFADLGNRAIEDHFTLQVNLVAAKK